MFSENLKTLRKQKGYTQEELAARLNVVRQTVSKWEKGLSVPDAELLLRLAEILEVPVSTLLGAAIPDDKKPDDKKDDDYLTPSCKGCKGCGGSLSGDLFTLSLAAIAVITVTLVRRKKYGDK